MKQFICISMAAVMVLTGLTGCQKEKNKPFQINFVNQTGIPILEAVVNSVSLGYIPSRGQTGYIDLDEFAAVNDMADCAFTAKWSGENIESERFVFCCSLQPTPLRPGQYEVLISVKTVGGKPYFDLKFKP